MAALTESSYVNGASAGRTAIPATKLLVSFVASASTEQLTPSMRMKVKEVLLDYIGVALGALKYAESCEPIYNAIVALQGPGNSGSCTVLGKGTPRMLPQYAGLLNATFAHSLDFDDTFTEGVLHAGVTAISAALTQAELLGLSTSSETFMLAISIGYEITCRLGVELGLEGSGRGMHNTGTAGIFGAIATIAVLKGLSPHVVEMAFGLAGSKSAGSMQYLENGAWNKRLHPGFAVHDAFMCVALAESGVIGATSILEGKMGFLNAYSGKEDKDLSRLTADLGSRWIWLASSLKPWSACRMAHVFIEMAGVSHSARGGKILADDVKQITLTMHPGNFRLIGDPTPNKVHPSNAIDAQFSAYFQFANALAYGSSTAMETYKKLDDGLVHVLSDKTIVLTDDSLPGFSGKMRIDWKDGHIEERLQLHPLGEAQHPFTRDKVADKFLSLASPVVGKETSLRIAGLVDGFEGHSPSELLKLLR